MDNWQMWTTHHSIGHFITDHRSSKSILSHQPHATMHPSHSEFLYNQLKAIAHSTARNVNSCLRLVKSATDDTDNESKVTRRCVEELAAKCCDFLRQFNNSFGEIINSTNDHEMLPYKKTFQMTNFAYAPAEVSGYRAETKYNGFVSHVTDSSMLFIIPEPVYLNLNEEVVEIIKQIPMPGVVFGIDLGADGVFRATRDNVMSLAPNKSSLILIDIGVILEASALKDRPMFKLSKKAQGIPAYAIPCKVAKVYDSDGTEIASASTKLPSVLHESIKFDVVGIDLPLADMMLVNIHKKPSTITVLQSSLNPFAPAFEMPKQNGTSPLVTSPVDVGPMNESSPKTRYDNGASGFTKEELEILFEEPLNTSNAMVAVMGYEPKDDARICKFFDPSTGKCFKGNNCKFEHVQIMKNGTTRDKCPAKMVDIHAKPKILNAHEIVDIIPLCVISVEEFYAYIPCEPGEMNPKQLRADMNTTENRSKFKPIQSAPEMLRLVFVRHYNNNFFRAKVIDYAEGKSDILLFVDYGYIEKISHDQMYEWSELWDYVPFLARKCRLVGVRMRREDDEDAINELTDRIVNKILKAFVESSSSDEVYVRLTDEYGFDVGHQMCEYGFAENGSIVPENSEDSQFPA